MEAMAMDAAAFLRTPQALNFVAWEELACLSVSVSVRLSP